LSLFAIQIGLLLSGTFGFGFGEDGGRKNSSGLYSISTQRSAVGEVACWCGREILRFLPNYRVH